MFLGRDTSKRASSYVLFMDVQFMKWFQIDIDYIIVLPPLGLKEYASQAVICQYNC